MTDHQQVGKWSEHACAKTSRIFSGFIIFIKICVLPLGLFKKHKQHEQSLRKTVLQRLGVWHRPLNIKSQQSIF